MIFWESKIWEFENLKFWRTKVAIFTCGQVTQFSPSCLLHLPSPQTARILNIRWRGIEGRGREEGRGGGGRGEGRGRGEGIGEGKIHTSASNSISCVALMAGACSIANGVVAVCVMRTSPMLYDTFIYICGRDKKMTKSSVRKRCYIMKRWRE